MPAAPAQRNAQSVASRCRLTPPASGPARAIAGRLDASQLTWPADRRTWRSRRNDRRRWHVPANAVQRLRVHRWTVRRHALAGADDVARGRILGRVKAGVAESTVECQAHAARSDPLSVSARDRAVPHRPDGCRRACRADRCGRCKIRSALIVAGDLGDGTLAYSMAASPLRSTPTRDTRRGSAARRRRTISRDCRTRRQERAGARSPTRRERLVNDALDDFRRVIRPAFRGLHGNLQEPSDPVI